MPLLDAVGIPIATVHGRFYAMDRDKRWDRTERSFAAIVDAAGTDCVAATAGIGRMK